MNDKIDIYRIIQDSYNTLPKFEDGRIDYSESNISPTLTCFLKYKDEILLLQRSKMVGSDKGKWSTVTGYLDELIEIEEKFYIEVEEETGISRELVSGIYKGEAYEFTDDKTWVICPILFELLEKPDIILNWEHVQYIWIHPEEMNNYDIVSDLFNTFKHIK
jgi:ADP-ribose pyrophosphatase YjhB (NUDIX family)